MEKNKWTQLASVTSITKTVSALKQNGIKAVVVENKNRAVAEVLKLLPKGASAMNMTSVTLQELGIPKIINESSNYDSLRDKLNKMDRVKQELEMQKIGAAPEWVIGSVHAITENGEILIASNTGSQLGAYAYGSMHVIWIAGTQKIVKNLNDGFKRIYEHSLPLESERAKKAYGAKGSNVGKLLIVNKEIQSGRITLILVKELLGF